MDKAHCPAIPCYIVAYVDAKDREESMQIIAEFENEAFPGSTVRDPRIQVRVMDDDGEGLGCISYKPEDLPRLMNGGFPDGFTPEEIARDCGLEPWPGIRDELMETLPDAVAQLNAATMTVLPDLPSDDAWI